MLRTLTALGCSCSCYNNTRSTTPSFTFVLSMAFDASRPLPTVMNCVVRLLRGKSRGIFRCVQRSWPRRYTPAWHLSSDLRVVAAANCDIHMETCVRRFTASRATGGTIRVVLVPSSLWPIRETQSRSDRFMRASFSRPRIDRVDSRTR